MPWSHIQTPMLRRSADTATRTIIRCQLMCLIEYDPSSFTIFVVAARGMDIVTRKERIVP